MQESKLYLVFEFLSMDLKKYLDTIPTGQLMDGMLVKVGGAGVPFSRLGLDFLLACLADNFPIFSWPDPFQFNRAVLSKWVDGSLCDLHAMCGHTLLL